MVERVETDTERVESDPHTGTHVPSNPHPTPPACSPADDGNGACPPVNPADVGTTQCAAHVEPGHGPTHIVFCGYTVVCVPTITVNVDEALKERMDRHPEINWSEVTRQAIRGKIEKLELLDELTAESELTEADVSEIASRIDERAHDREAR